MQKFFKGARNERIYLFSCQSYEASSNKSRKRVTPTKWFTSINNQTYQVPGLEQQIYQLLVRQKNPY